MGTPVAHKQAHEGEREAASEEGSVEARQKEDDEELRPEDIELIEYEVISNAEEDKKELELR